MSRFTPKEVGQLLVAAFGLGWLLLLFALFCVEAFDHAVLVLGELSK